MSVMATFLIATFTAPEQVGVNPQSMLLLLPLLAAISIVYKATKLPKIATRGFAKEVAALFASIVVVIIAIALVLYVLTWLVTQ